MTKNLRLISLLAALVAILSLTGCGEKTGLVIKNGPAGPKTGDMIDPLPEGLIADKTNSRHTDNDLKPVIN